MKSDHKPLIYLFNLKDPSSKLTRLRLELAEFNFTIEHIPGKDNVVADALSRIHIRDIIKTQSEEVSIKAITRSMSKNNIPPSTNQIKNNDSTLNETKYSIYESHIFR